MSKKGGIIGGIISIVIGSTIYNVDTQQVVDNFSKDTGMSQEQAKSYVEKTLDEDLVSYDYIGESFISEGNNLKKEALNLDCDNNNYAWESNNLSCSEGKHQLIVLADSSINLGKAYFNLSLETADKSDTRLVIKLIDKYNNNLKFNIVSELLDYKTVTDIKNTNSFNKAILQAALDSD